MRSRKEKTAKDYQVRIPNGDNFRKRVEALSERTGRKMYSITQEAMAIGIEALEQSTGAGK